MPRLRIGLVAPLYEAVPPRAYGGTEVVVHLLTEELVRRGHRVTLFASGDSVTSARLVVGSPAALWSPASRHLRAEEAQELARRHHEAPYASAAAFDIIHDHGGVAGLRAAVEAGVELALVTHHGEVEPEMPELLERFRGRHNAISRAAAATYPSRGQVAPVHNGIDVADFPFGARPEGYLLFLGRFSPEKGAGTAVQVARRSGRRLLLAGRIHPHERVIFEREVAPYLDERIRYVGEANSERKRLLLAGADALLFPILWDEPFGLVMIEALACGTPVLATDRASAPEVVEAGVTGFLAGPGTGGEADVAALTAVLPHLPLISRAACRRAALARFTVERMVDDYEARYAEVLGISPARQLASA
ncbi:MAG TPA: glycosyltransferase family 4 protein [Candidatus Limnocylindrales bacterium]|nr:glycosyltransferase family 4 protein [Candidatus Limnocylindrales bacterium]